MGMSEDDRIRNKNQGEDIAYDQYLKLKLLYSDDRIVTYCNDQLVRHAADPIRNKMYSSIQRIARSACEQFNIATNAGKSTAGER
jgi:hypothetical protein